MFNYRDEREHINKLTGNIKVVWNKESDNVVYDLLYHDLYLLYPLIKCNKLLMEDITFEYGQSDERTHKINDIDFTHTNDSNDALLKMISCVLNDKVDYKYNKEIVLFTNAIIEEYFNND